MRVVRQLLSRSYWPAGPLSWLFAVVCSIATGGQADAQDQPGSLSAAEREVRVADSARFAAMTHGNLIALDTLLGADLSYTHNDGTRESKTVFLNSIRSGDL